MCNFASGPLCPVGHFPRERGKPLGDLSQCRRRSSDFRSLLVMFRFSVVGLFEGVIFPMYGMCDVETRSVLASTIALRRGW